ncbi:alpha/beta fold hydrolase [Roseisalinus antarcticus]|uniref:Phospholipase YtpA n=1 Tax=Roseisalinus antarcticus TaxID=254357 RepID=A0A1Y5RYL7_9RHOB|nr:alpha/beta hydrolase [Roseisalinus antarcticus]SLN27452.1 Phospholipase YtpA [Roseisalinus antarcticus]
MEPAPYFADVADGPPDGVAHWVTTSDGLRLRVGHWPLEKASGTVLIFPGRTEYIEKYGRDAQALAERGFAAATIDWRGQGISARINPDPKLGHVDRFVDYQTDVAAFLDHVDLLDLPGPYFLLAHSMGGCIGLRSVLEGLPVPAVAFSAPMWGIQMSAALRPIAWGLSSLSRPLRFSRAFAPGQVAEPYILRSDFAVNSLTSDKSMFDYMQHQLQAHPDLALGGPSLHWLNEALREMRGLVDAPSPDLPCVTFLGTDEAIVDPARIEERMARWDGGDLVPILNGRHEVLMETAHHRRAIFDRIAEHFSAAA